MTDECLATTQWVGPLAGAILVRTVPEPKPKTQTKCLQETVYQLLFKYACTQKMITIKDKWYLTGNENFFQILNRHFFFPFT